MAAQLSTAAWFHLFGHQVAAEPGPAAVAPVTLMLSASLAQLRDWGDVSLDLEPRRGGFLRRRPVPSVRVTWRRRSGARRPGLDTRFLALVELEPLAAHDLFWQVSGKRGDFGTAVEELVQHEVTAAGLTGRAAVRALAPEFAPRHEMWRRFCQDHPQLLDGLVNDVYHAAVGKHRGEIY